MSSTNRGKPRHVSDHYVTPHQPIKDFLNAFLTHENISFDSYILDPCAGGSETHGMPYPEVLSDFGFTNIISNDIREESPSQYKLNYLDSSFNDCVVPSNIIIANPPFNLAMEFIEKALDDVTGNHCMVIMLLRLNFLGSVTRFKFWKDNPPKYIFVHHKRISFIPENIIYIDNNDKECILKKGSTDSVEYCHIVWQKKYKENTKLFVI